MKKNKKGSIKLHQNPKTMSSAVTQEVKQRISLRSATAVAMIAIGLGLLGGGAYVAIKQFQAAQLPAIKPLTEGTYAPAQVVFKVKAGKDANTIVKKALAKKQTLYKNKTNKKTVASYDAAVKKTPSAFQKQDIQLTQKSLRPVFPKATVSDDVKAKIALRNGAQDPDKVYAELGMDRWYVAEVNQAEADVPTIIQQLAGDTGNVEKVEANTIAKPLAVQRTTVEEPVAADGDGTSAAKPLGTSATTSCSDPNDPYSCAVGDVPNAPKDQWGLSAINFSDAWRIAGTWPNNRAKPILAILDSGIDLAHPDLRNEVWLNSGENVNGNDCADYWRTTDYSGHADCHGVTVYTGGDLDSIDNDGNGYTDDLNGMDFQNATYIDKGWAVNTLTGPADDDGHGTLVASVAAASTNNDTGMAGVCPFCAIMPLRVIGTIAGPRRDEEGTVAQISKAMIYATDNGADVINLSASVGPDQVDNLYLLDDAIRYAYELGVVNVASSGNCNEDFGYSLPASNPRVIAVGGIDISGQRYVDMNRPSNQCNTVSNGTSGSSYGQNLTLMAPFTAVMGALGHNVDRTALPILGMALINPNRDLNIVGGVPYVDPTLNIDALIEQMKNIYYMYASGTSFSSPIVAGVASMVRAINPALGVDDVRNLLTDTATHMPNVKDENGNIVTIPGDWNQYAGYGLVQAGAAMQAAVNSVPDLKPEPNYTFAETLGSTILRLRTSIINSNYGIYAVSHIPVRFTDQDNNILYEETIDRLLPGGFETIYYDKTINGPMPTKINVIVDPLHTIPDKNTDNNTLANVSVVAFGTPMFQPLPAKAASPGTAVSLNVSATTDAPVDPATIQITASNLPSGAQFANRQFTWTPTNDTLNGTYQPVFTATVTVPETGGTPAYTVTNTTAATITMTGGKTLPTPTKYEFSSSSAVFISAQNKIHIRFVMKNISATAALATNWGYTFHPGTNPIINSDCLSRSGGAVPALAPSETYAVDAYFPVTKSCEADQESISVYMWPTYCGDMACGSIPPMPLERAPVFSTLPAQSAIIGNQLEFSISANNNSPAVSYTTDPATVPNGANLIDRTFFWTPTPDQIGERVVRFTASNEAGSATQDVRINVAVPDFLVTIDGGNTAAIKVGAGTTRMARLTSNNGFSGSVTLSAITSNPNIWTQIIQPTVTVPNGGSATKLFIFGAREDAPLGAQTLLVTATANGQTRTATVVITVLPPNAPPVMSYIGPKNAARGLVNWVTVTADDPDDTELTYSASNLPPGATFNSDTHQLRWSLSPLSYYKANYVVTFTVRDASGASDSENVVISVIGYPGTPAAFSLIEDFSALESGSLTGIGCSDREEIYSIPFKVKNIGGLGGRITPTATVANCSRDRSTDPWRCSSPVVATVVPAAADINTGQTTTFNLTTAAGTIRGGEFYRYSISVPGYTATSPVSKNGCQW